mmetsp:Transcript_46139/g.76857  ORF Transcript_46139/g.76857 Transcript_46139/m.76857 type:complete len:1090 (-) Transcript_46139:322-3591(-)
MSEFVDLDAEDPMVDSFDDVSVDEDSSKLERLNKYLCSKVLIQRLSHVKLLAECARETDFEETRRFIFNRLPQLMSDEAEVKAALADQLAEIAEIFLVNDHYTDVIDVFLHHVSKLLYDDATQVREAAADAIIKMGPMLSPEHLESPLLRIVIMMAHDELEERRATAAKMLNELAPVFGADLCNMFAVPELRNLCQDASSRVRKAAIANIDRLIEMVGRDSSERSLLPLFLDVCDDESWAVRKSCAESIVALSEVVSATERTKKLSGCMDVLIQDTSRWVRTAALQQLAPFIATMTDSPIPSCLLEHFRNMANNQQADADLCRCCAFHFPAVALMLGPERWSEISATYIQLVNDSQWKVRHTLAHSLHEMAKILGPSITEDVLLPVFDNFLRDIEEVKIGVVRHIAEFLEALSPPHRLAYLPVLSEIQADSENWRFRKLLAGQIAKLTEIYDRDIVESLIVPLTLRLCTDPVDRVRQRAYKAAASLYVCLPSASTVGSDNHLRYELLKFATDRSFPNRQSFVRICEEIMRRGGCPSFDRDLLPALLRMVNDRVPNVRLALARLLANGLYPLRPYRRNPEVLNALKALSTDTDRDVRSLASTPPVSTDDSTTYGSSRRCSTEESSSNHSRRCSIIDTPSRRRSIDPFDASSLSLSLTVPAASPPRRRSIDLSSVTPPPPVDEPWPISPPLDHSLPPSKLRTSPPPMTRIDMSPEQQCIDPVVSQVQAASDGIEASPDAWGVQHSVENEWAISPPSALGSLSPQSPPMPSFAFSETPPKIMSPPQNIFPSSYSSSSFPSSLPASSSLPPPSSLHHHNNNSEQQQHQHHEQHQKPQPPILPNGSLPFSSSPPQPLLLSNSSLTSLSSSSSSVSPLRSSSPTTSTSSPSAQSSQESQHLTSSTPTSPSSEPSRPLLVTPREFLSPDTSQCSSPQPSSFQSRFSTLLTDDAPSRHSVPSPNHYPSSSLRSSSSSSSSPSSSNSTNASSGVGLISPPPNNVVSPLHTDVRYRLSPTRPAPGIVTATPPDEKSSTPSSTRDDEDIEQEGWSPCGEYDDVHYEEHENPRRRNEYRINLENALLTKWSGLKPIGTQSL